MYHFFSLSLSLSLSIRKEILPVDSDILTVICDVLYGQLEGYITVSDAVISEAWKQRECTQEERERLLADYLSFLNTLLSVSDTMFAVISSSKWFNLLLKIVDIQDNTGRNKHVDINNFYTQ